MSDLPIQNAVIESTMLGFEGHGILTANITFELAGGHQGFGGYVLGKEYTDYWVREILKTLDIETWEQLPGTRVRLKGGGNEKIVAVGHFLHDKWFYPKKPV